MRITGLVTRRNSTARNSVTVSTEITVIRLLGRPGQVKPNRLPRKAMCGPNNSTMANRPMW